MSHVGTIRKVKRSAKNGPIFVNVYFREFRIQTIPEKAMCRLFPLLPVGAVLQLSNTNSVDLPEDVVGNNFYFEMYCNIKLFFFLNDYIGDGRLWMY